MKIHDKDYFYKYVSASTLIKILQFQTMRWSSPLLFNDPFDLQVDPFGLSENELTEAIIKNYRVLIKTPEIKIFGSIDPKLLHFRNAYQRGDINDGDVETVVSEYRKEMVDYKFELRDEEKLRIEKHLAEDRVFCVAEENDNLLMWAHYADSHKGAVVKIKCIPELDTPLCAATSVIYQRELPRIGALEDLAKYFLKIGEKPNITNFAYTKSEHWSYEKEWRCIGGARNLEKLYDDSRFNPEEIEAIFLGCKMVKNDRDVIRHNLLYPRYSHVKVFQAKINDREFKLDFEKVALTSPNFEA